MMKRFIYLLGLGFLLTGCVDESYYGESNLANILTFDIEGQTSNKVDPKIDWRDVGEVLIEVPSSFNLSNLKVTKVVYTQLAHCEVVADSIKDFSQPVELTVVAEKQSIKKKWIIKVTKKIVEKVQLPFSNFQQWFEAKSPSGVAVTVGGKQGYFPGSGKENSPWQSSIEGNQAGSTMGIKDFSVYPMPQWDKAKYARLMTVNAGQVAANTVGAGLASGGLFTGYFAMDMKYALNGQPRKMINSGVPFYSKPIAAKFDIRYKGGATMLNGKLKPYIPGIGKPSKDSCDVQIILQNRLTNKMEWIRVATAALRIDQIGNMTDEEKGFISVTLPFVYGAPTAEQIKEKPYQKIGGSVGELVYYNFTFTGGKWVPEENPVKEIYAADPKVVEVDNIIVLFSSSAYGDTFHAAEGSTLDVRNFELIYD